jgi:2-C-methyl-D-erythritol 4-phosphate cytidylyltransferase
MSSSYYAIVPAAGSGKRFGGAFPKQYCTLGKKTVIEYALEALLAHPLIAKVIVVVAKDDANWVQLDIAKHPKIITTLGGSERSHSVLNGLEALTEIVYPQDWVLVHDAARPLLQGSDIDTLISRLTDEAIGGLLAIPIHATLKRVEHEHVVETVSRENLWQALTPQMFRFALLQQALKAGLAQSPLPSDEAQAVELLGYSPVIVPGASDNLKVTYPYDLEWMNKIIGE